MMRASRSAGRAAERLGVLASLALLAFACAGGAERAKEGGVDVEQLPPDVRAALEVVTGLQDAMLGIMKRGPDLGYAGRVAAISAIARVSFDIPTLARASYGPGFEDLTEEQKERWLAVYERFHISSLADVRARYAGQTYETIGYEEPGPGVVVVQSKLDYPGRAVDLSIDYRLRRTTDGWRIVDVHNPPSVSEVAMRRAEYRTVRERHGFEGLVDEMESRIDRRERR